MIKKRSRQPIEYKDDLGLNWTYISDNGIKYYKCQYDCTIHHRKNSYECYLKGILIVQNILSLEAAKLICNVILNDYVLHSERLSKR